MELVCFCVFDLNRRRNPVLCKSDVAGAQFRLDALVLNRIEAIPRQQRIQRIAVFLALIAVRQKPLQKASGSAARTRNVSAEITEALQVRSLAG